MRRAIIVGLSLLAFSGALGQRLTVEAPWLLGYDAQGDVLWEIRAEVIHGDRRGWEAERVRAILYSEGKVALEAELQGLFADPQGERWHSVGKVTGRGDDFSFTATEISWAGGELTVKDLSLESGDLSLRARIARWHTDGIWVLEAVEGTFGPWKFSFPRGTYDPGRGTVSIGSGLRAEGWGLVVDARAARLSVREGKVILEEVEAGPA